MAKLGVWAAGIEGVGALQEGRSEGPAFAPHQNHLVPKLLSRGQAWQLRAARAFPSCRTVLRDTPGHQSTLIPPIGPHTVLLPHHPTLCPSLAPPAPALPKQPREAPSLVCGAQGPTGHGPQSTCRVAEEHDWAAPQPQGGAPAHPKPLLAVVLAPPVPAEHPPRPSSNKPHRAFEEGTNYSIPERRKPAHTHTQRRAVKADEARVGEQPCLRS